MFVVQTFDSTFLISFFLHLFAFVNVGNFSFESNHVDCDNKFSRKSRIKK